MKSLLNFLMVLLICGAGFVLAGFMIGFVDQISHLPVAIAKIESVRASAQAVRSDQAEDVAGLVATWNIEIARKKALNKIPFICISVANGWDDIQPIEMPKGEQR